MFTEQQLADMRDRMAARLRANLAMPLPAMPSLLSMEKFSVVASLVPERSTIMEALRDKRNGGA